MSRSWSMIPQSNHTFGGGAAESALHPMVLGILVVAAVLMWKLPRKYVIVPFLVVGILVPLEQQLVVGGLHFMVLRLVLFCAWLRVLADVRRGDKLLTFGLGNIDKIVVAWVVAGVITFTLLWLSPLAFINRLGYLYNALGVYFLLRHLLRDRDDVLRLVRVLAVLCAVLAVLMTIEQLTGRNLLSIFGMPEQAEVRAGRIRSQAAFAHPIIAGTCGAMLLPLFIGLWPIPKKRAYAVIGIAAATVMTLTSASSTPVAAYAAALVAVGFWPLRRYMVFVRWGSLAMIVALHMVMKAPVWALIARIDFAGGSTGWHRFLLLDNFIHKFGEWWLLGTRDNARWGYQMWDAIDSYVAAGVGGGLLGLILFVAVIAASFAAIGRFLKRKDTGPRAKRFAWSLGASLFAATVAFFGISFFDQSIVLYYALPAMIVTMTANVRIAVSGPVPALIPETIAVASPLSQPIDSTY